VTTGPTAPAGTGTGPTAPAGTGTGPTAPAGTAPRSRLLAVARGDAEPDLVVAGARVFSAFTREWLDGDVAVADGRIAGIGRYDGGERIDAAGRRLVPGSIDAHVHVESSKLLPAEFARVLVARGTTAVVCDPHEIANVLGAAGVRWLLEASDGLPLRVFAMAPPCVPASALESPCGSLGPGEMAEILSHERAIGIAEVMDFPSVIAGDAELLAKLALHGHVDGHAPRVTGAALDAYAAAGIRSDHECTTWEEALEKRRRGLWVLLREASNARNLVALLELVRRYGPEQCAFCTDDREPDMLMREGHIDAMCRRAVAEGIAPEDALLMATLHPARCHGLAELGAIAPGFHADMALLDDLESFRASLVIAGGTVAARDGEALAFAAPAVPGWLRDSVRVAPLGVDAFELGAGGERVRVIDIVPGQLITGAAHEPPALRDGRVVADPGRDLAKLVVVERHHATGRVGAGLVRGFGLRDGAFASTVAHDAHNVVVVGADDASMMACVRRLAELGGGIAVARDGRLRGELALPVAGLLSEEPAEAVVARLDELVALLREQGVESDAPFMTLSFLALSVIPDLKLTDRGLVDVATARVVPLVV
jgi:adenine deaminase